MNYVWLFLVAIAVITAAFTGSIEAVTQSALDSAGTAVTIAINLIGIMTLWLGIMKIAEEAGLIRLLANAIRPLSRFLFPDVPSDHPAIGAILLNLSANWLGLGNAATPLGIKAMEHLQTLNEDKETASNAMIMFLALNTASITLIPMTIIAVRAGLNSQNPAEIIGTTIFASGMATLTAITAVKFFSAVEGGRAQIRQTLVSAWKGIVMVILGVAGAVLLLRTGVLHHATGFLPADFFRNSVMFVSRWAIPFLLLTIPMIGFARKIKVYEVFVEGAKDGFHVAVRIIPFLVAILVAVGMFRASGGMEFFVRLLSPATSLIGMPAEVLPAALMRPLSGSGALGIITELINTHGPDSFIGRLASTLYGCTETTFYVIAVYFGAVQVKKTRFAIPAGLIADFVGILAAVFICRIMF
ncbi:spore maturation protein [candidate division KSB1 bacterium]|nr:spore maturation protein [candidate division KSB1 bacterium]